jgi:Ni2+-binding GTPase involved in maturation of urease and hydrogenase
VERLQKALNPLIDLTLMSWPGAGKTTLVERTIRDLWSAITSLASRIGL